MALYFKNPQTGPKTHILLIGIGGYNFLSNGADELEQQFDGAKLMGQLSSPPASIKAFYDSVLKLHEGGSWITPLGSIDVLVSSPPGAAPAFAGMAEEMPTIGNIKRAYWRWRALCDSDPDNVALFFFCGHGLEKGEHYLLAQDFGEMPGSPWDGSFAFDMTRRAFSTCRARTQIFMVDSCRQVTSDMLSSSLPLNPIEPPSLLARDCQFSLVQKAAAANEKAYGPKGEASYYTKALIKALEGNAADNDSGTSWMVSTGTLASKMNLFLKAEADTEGYAQRCISTTSDVTALIRLNAPPEVPLSITCDPEQALGLASLSCKELHTNIGPTRLPEPMPWDIKVRAGVYKVEASFLEGTYKNIIKYKPVSPPWAKEQLNCN